MYYSSTPIFGVGARVKVIRQPNKYWKDKLVGLIGTVRSESGKSISVIFDTVQNERSSYGCFYFKVTELELMDEPNNEIMEEKNMPKITNYFNAVTVQFIGDVNPCPCVYANFDEGLKVGDLCVVKPAHHELALARVAKIIDKNAIELQREIVAKVYTDDYDFRVEMRNKAAELKAKMEARAKQLQDIALYQMLAKDDPDMADLLERYQSLPKV